MQNISNFLKTQYTFTLSTTTILLVILIALIGIITIFYLIVSLYKRLHLLQTPKYGFLGKPLLQVIFAFFIVGGVIFSVYTATKDAKLEEIYANEELTLEFNSVVGNKVGNKYPVSFTLVPLINGKPWGDDPEREFDIYVTIEGPENSSEALNNKTQQTGVYFTKSLSKGNYTLNITIISGNATKTFIQYINL